MTEQEQLFGDQGVKKAVAAENDRRLRLKSLEARIQAARVDLAKEESSITSDSIDSPSFDGKIKDISERRVRVEQLERVRDTSSSQEAVSMKAIGSAKAAFLVKQRSSLNAELERLAAKAAPHLAALLEIEGTEFGPAFELQSRGRLDDHLSGWEKVSKSSKLRKSIFDLDRRIEALQSGLEQQGRDIFEQIMTVEATKASGSVATFIRELF